MGLLDWFRRPPDVPLPTKEDWLRIGRLEAQVESLRFQWETYKDEINKLVQRLEKRDQRAAQREKEAEAKQTQPVETDHDFLERKRRDRGLR